MKKNIAALLLIFAAGLPLWSQPGEQTAEFLFYEADYWYTEEEDFLEASFLFKQVLAMEPENANVQYLLGMCYNHIHGMAEEAIPYFHEATKNITLKYRNSRYQLKQAPHDSWYYLADAYRKTNQLSEARMALDSFSSLMNFEKYYNVRLTEEAIEQVERAKIIRDAELNLRALYFKEPINTVRSDYSGVISADGKMMVWVTSKPLYQAVFMSTRNENDWSLPVEITTQVVSDGNLFPTGLSSDGTTMLLTLKPTKGDSDIWYSRYDGRYWSPAQPVFGDLNSNSNEVHASFSPDGNRIYFASDRRGGEGGLDIWYSDKQVNGQWGTPVNMGENINTAEDETSAYIAPTEERFIFASKGHFNMGGYDIFRCEIDNSGNWGQPVNIGYPVNTTSDDTYYVPLNDGLSGLYSRYTRQAIGEEDLWYVEIQGEEGFITDGLVLAVDTREGIASKDFAIVLVDESTGEEIEVIYDSKEDAFKARSGTGKTFRVVSYKQK
ncbi:MAG: tetratricopeptide repeat protein [Bacteroidales bacterium]